MLDPDFTSMDDYVDIESINAYRELRDSGKTDEEAFAIIKAKSRDNSRTPMQWDDSTYAGFSTAKPWLALGASHKDINVASEMSGKIFPFYQKLIALRKNYPIIAEGDYKAAYQESHQIYAFERQLDEQKLLVFNNFSAEKVELDLPEVYINGQVLVSNYTTPKITQKLTLNPYQTLAILIEN